MKRRFVLQEMSEDRFRKRHNANFEMKSLRSSTATAKLKTMLPTGNSKHFESAEDLNSLLNEVNSFLEDTKKQYEQLELESEKLCEWMKENASLDPNNPAQVEEAMKLLSESKEAKASNEQLDKQPGLLRIKKTDDGSFVLTLPKEIKRAEDSPVDSEYSAEGSKAQRRGTGNKNLSRMQQLNEKATVEKPKVPNQTPINVFWQFVEGFFKPINEDDMKLLEDTDEKFPQVYLMPALGKPYHSQWKENERVPDVVSEAIRPSLMERLLSCLVEENILPPSESEEVFDKETTVQDYQKDGNEYDMIDFEERLKKELLLNGILHDDMIIDHRESDEISVEIRSLQSQLRHQSDVNKNRKRILAEYIKSRIASQEFYSILDEIDKQIDSIFSRKWKTMKKRKKGQPVTICPVMTELQPLVDKRKTLIQYFKDVIPTRLHLISSNSQQLFPPVELNTKSFYLNGIPTLPPKFPVSRKAGIFQIEQK